MGIDTRDKRASVLGVNSSAPRLEQNPSGTISQSGRQIAGLIYSGILAASGASAPSPRVILVRNRLALHIKGIIYEPLS